MNQCQEQEQVPLWKREKKMIDKQIPKTSVREEKEKKVKNFKQNAVWPGDFELPHYPQKVQGKLTTDRGQQFRRQTPFVVPWIQLTANPAI